MCLVVFFLFKHKTAYELRISDWSSDVCSSDLADPCRQPDMCGGRQIAHLAAADDDQPGRDDADRRGHALDDAQRIYPRLWTAQLIVERGGDDGDRKSTRLNASH